MSLAHRRPSVAATTAPRREDAGYILVKFSFLLVPLLLLTGLSVDVGSWYGRLSDIQKAADAAALAGVVWLPDEELAEDYALEAAARNGFVHGQDGIEVSVLPVGERQLRVTINDPEVGSFLFENLGGHTLNLGRSASAEYVLPVPLGSPRNFFGTGPLASGYNENLWLSVNTWCTDKVDGDRYQSPFSGNRKPASGGGSSYTNESGRCPTTHSGSYVNDEYRPRGYEYYIDVPTTRAGNIDVLLFDARYNTDAPVAPWTSPIADCTWYPVTSGSTTTINIVGVAGTTTQYQTRSTTGGSWSSVQTLAVGDTLSRNVNLVQYRYGTSGTWYGGNNSNLVIRGPLRYQTRTNTSQDWSGRTIQTLASGSTVTGNRDLLRYETCVDQVDLNLYSGDHDFKFTLFAADATPLNDSDNIPVPGCTRTFSAGTPFDPITYLGHSRWNRLCTIDTNMPTGRYIMRVTNTQGSRYAAGANNFSLVAKYSSAPYTAVGSLCDARSVTTCPRVYGKDAMSVFANQQSATADFFLAEIDPIHVGKTLQVELFDPGEGGTDIRMRRPTGANSWQDATFSWTSTNPSYPSGGPTTSLSVTGDRFNGHTVRILINLNGYNPPANNRWWQVRYNFGSGTVTDRTTWSAQVLGDPVHLYEEDV